MHIKIEGASEHNLKNIDTVFSDGLTAVTGLSGSGKTSLVFDTLFSESQRRFREVFSFHHFTEDQQPAKVRKITGLGPAVALGQDLLNRNPNSIVATASGLHPLLRILYARFGKRFCHNCGAEAVIRSEDQIIDIIGNLSIPIQFRAILVKKIQGSHQTLLQQLNSLYPDQLIIDNKVFKSQLLKKGLDPAVTHTIEILLETINKKPAITKLRGLLQSVSDLDVSTINIVTKDSTEEFSLDTICSECGKWLPELKPVHFNTPCYICHGKGCERCKNTGLHVLVARVEWMGLTLTQFLAKTIDEAYNLLQQLFNKKQLNKNAQRTLDTTADSRILHEIFIRLESMHKVGLGYIQLNRPSPTLSRGEAQRLRLAVALVCKLEDMLHVLDEPTIGQHPSDVDTLIQNFRDLPGPVIFIEHDRMAVAQADHCLDLGPGAGKHGGEVLFSGTPQKLWRQNTPTGRYFSQREKVILPAKLASTHTFLKFSKAYARNLQNIDVSIPLSSLTVITGVSGSGKSTLIEEVIVKTLLKKRPQNCQGFKGDFINPLFIDQSPIGRNPRSNPATYTKCSDILRDFFAEKTKLSASFFSFNRPEGSCPVCQGLGALEVKLKHLPSMWITCSVCDGKRFSDEVLNHKVSINDQQFSIADVYELSIEDVYALFEKDNLIAKKYKLNLLHQMKTLIDVGLGYLTLGQKSPTLSGGEAQRVKLAKSLGKRHLKNKLIILDEPTTGLHPMDVNVLLKVLSGLVQNGASIITVEHNTDVIRAADWIIDLGPGAGPYGGKVLYQGRLNKLLSCKNSLTTKVLKEENKLKPTHVLSKKYQSKTKITLKNVRTHNLKNITVAFEKGKINVVTGVSGSGKSSLVHDVLENEAKKRFLESLSMYERQNTREKLESSADEIKGLGLAVSIGHDRKIYNVRATVGTITGLTHHLAVLFAFTGTRKCPQCGILLNREEKWSCPQCGFTDELPLPRYFSPSNYHAACITCHGIGTLRKPNPGKLITRPDLPLCRGAMYSPGFFPKGYLCKPFNGGYDLVCGLAKVYHFNPVSTPWAQMSKEAQKAFLYGTQEKIQVHFKSRTGRERITSMKFPGFYKWVGDWDQGGTYTDTEICPACKGARLKPQFLAVHVLDRNFHDYHVIPIEELFNIMSALKLTDFSNELVRDNLETVIQKLKFLTQVGIGYLNLARLGRTLSVGEVQRIRISALLSSELTGITVILDEPTRGMHPTEVAALVKSFKTLTDIGNTLVIVEHDPEVIQKGDIIYDLGPGSGKNGGFLQAKGTPAEIKNTPTLTGKWLSGKIRALAFDSRKEPKQWMKIQGATENNLKIKKLKIPLEVLTGICGVSGSGKSTLIIDTIGRILAPKKYTTSVAREEITPGAYKNLTNAPARTLVIDQSKAGVYSPMRFMNLKSIFEKIYGSSEAVLASGLNPELFSKRCTACKGRGKVIYDMGFLPDVGVTCTVCEGTGYPPEILDIKVRGHSLPQVFSLSVDEVYELWQDVESASRPLRTLRTVGLGYLILNQDAISGGESQRMKIAYELCKKQESVSTLFLLDEPTVGLHLEDISKLILTLKNLVKLGNSIIVIEHHPSLLAACDYLIELGPDGGPKGGQVIAEGPPERIASMKTPIAPYILLQLKNRTEVKKREN
ncbi:ATP-binding cassette domain-containing protein [candidate division WOR-3 bacterium]|nr:ATP-binding cassette domain-containing protein [candidate division WOR-3 bacterium]